MIIRDGEFVESRLSRESLDGGPLPSWVELRVANESKGTHHVQIYRPPQITRAHDEWSVLTQVAVPDVLTALGWSDGDGLTWGDLLEKLRDLRGLRDNESALPARLEDGTLVTVQAITTEESVNGQTLTMPTSVSLKATRKDGRYSVVEVFYSAPPPGGVAAQGGQDRCTPPDPRSTDPEQGASADKSPRVTAANTLTDLEGLELKLEVARRQAAAASELVDRIAAERDVARQQATAARERADALIADRDMWHERARELSRQLSSTADAHCGLQDQLADLLGLDTSLGLDLTTETEITDDNLVRLLRDRLQQGRGRTLRFELEVDTSKAMQAVRKLASEAELPLRELTAADRDRKLSFLREGLRRALKVPDDRYPTDAELLNRLRRVTEGFAKAENALLQLRALAHTQRCEAPFEFYAKWDGMFRTTTEVLVSLFGHPAGDELPSEESAS